MQKTLKLLIVADQRRTRQNLRALLATWPALGVIREAVNDAEVLMRIFESIAERRRKAS